MSRAIKPLCAQRRDTQPATAFVAGLPRACTPQRLTSTLHQERKSYA